MDIDNTNCYGTSRFYIVSGRKYWKTSIYDVNNCDDIYLLCPSCVRNVAVKRPVYFYRHIIFLKCYRNKLLENARLIVMEYR